MATEELLKELLGTEKKKDFDIQQYLRLVWRKKHLIVFPLFLSWLIAIVGLNYIPDTYVAYSSVAVNPSTGFVRDLQVMLDEEQRQRRWDNSQLSQVRAEIVNQGLLNEVITSLGMDKTPIIRERAQKLIETKLKGYDLEDVVLRLAAGEIRSRTEVRLGSLNVYRIETESHDPANAFYLNQALTQKFVETRRRRELADVTAKGDFSDEQVAIHKEKLHRAEQELERFQESQQQVAAQGNPVGRNNVEQAERVMSIYREELKHLENQVNDYRTGLREAFGFVPTNDQLLSNQDLLALENKQIHTMLQNLVEYLLVGSRRTGSLTEVIEDSSVGRDRQNYRDELIRLVNGIYGVESVNRREEIVGYYYRLMLVNTFQEIVTTVDRYITNFRQNLSGAPAVQAELDRREAEVSKYRELLATFQQQSTSAQITRAIQASQLATRIEVRDNAVMPLRPIRPNRMRLQIIFVLLGLITGFALIILTEVLNRSFSDTKEIENVLGVPVLGTIPAMDKGPGQAKIQVRKNTLLWVIGLIMFVAVLSGLMVFLKNMNSRLEFLIDREAVQEMVER